MKERNDQQRECGGTRRGQSGGTDGKDKVGNAHERVRALRRKGRWEKIKSGGKSIRKGERAVEGERAGEEERGRERAGWGLWLPLLTAIDFL